MLYDLVKKFPLFSGLLIVFVTMLLPWGFLYPLSFYLNFYLYQAIKYGMSFIIALSIVFLIYHGFSFQLISKHLFKNLFSYGLLGVIGAVMAFIFSFNEIDGDIKIEEVIYFFLYVLFISLSEELIFRILILNIFLEAWQFKKSFVLKAVIITSLIFGLRHLINLITMPNTFYSTIAQVFFTFMAGFYLSALYIRTRSIITCLIIHFLEDFGQGIWLVLSTNAFNSQNSDGNPSMLILLVVLQSIYLIFGILMLKDKNYHYEPLRRVKNV